MGTKYTNVFNGYKRHIGLCGYTPKDKFAQMRRNKGK